MIKALIVEDDEVFADLLIKKIGAVDKDVEVVAVAPGYTQACEMILSIKPQLVLMDINMEGKTAFDILNALPLIDFEIIFITAYKDYAYEAFRYAAADYIVKPCHNDDLVRALNRVQEKLKRTKFLPEITKIPFATASGTLLVAADDIIHCDAHRNYTKIHMNNNEQLLVSKNLKEVQQQLPPRLFFRPHHSYLINLQHVMRVNKASGSSLVMSNKAQIPVSRAKKEELMALFPMPNQG